MGFGEAISSVFRQYAVFNGRARRSEYWWYSLFALLLYIVAFIFDAATSSIIFFVLVALATFLPGLAVSVRRLHDTDRSGAWVLISLVPFVGGIVLLVFECQDSTPGPNRYGPSPKYQALPPWQATPPGPAQYAAPPPPAGYAPPPNPAYPAGPVNRRCVRGGCPQYLQPTHLAQCPGCGGTTQQFTPVA